MVECVDDPTIPDTESLWRRVPRQLLVVVDGVERPMSGLFCDPEMSVHLASLTSVEKIASLYPDHGIVEITVGLVRELRLRIVRNPTPLDPSHAIVCPQASPGARRRLAKACTPVRPVPPLQG
jgi:hypothetical protein